jgi:GTPase
VIHCGVIR